MFFFEKKNQKTFASHGVGYAAALRVWARVAALSFGGPAGQIAVMHRILVDEEGWIGETRFLHALSYCTLLPGPEAQQLAIYIGWLMHGVPGGIAAGTLFVLPGLLSIMLLSIVYAAFGHVAAIAALFFGLKAAVLAIVLQAVLRVGARALKTRALLAIAAAAFAAIFLLGVPFPLIVLASGLLGWAGTRAGWIGGARGGADAGVPDDSGSRLGEGQPAYLRAPAWRTAALWLTLWLVPVVALRAFLGPENTFSRIAGFFSEMAVVTFGGAYAVLAYVAQQAVGHYHWLQAGEMLDGLGLAETTPGPLIMVTQFVGFLAAYRNHGHLAPMLAGILGGLLTTWVTFTPCFLWIFLGAPFVEALRGNKALGGALAGITAAVVGVILNLAVWFALQCWFARRHRMFGLDLPVFSSLDPWALALSFAALLTIFGLRVGIIPTLLATACAGLVLHFAGVLA